MDAAFSYNYLRLVLENKSFIPLPPIRKNYPKIIVNNGPEFYSGRLESIGYEAMLRYTSALIKH